MIPIAKIPYANRRGLPEFNLMRRTPPQDLSLLMRILDTRTMRIFFGVCHYEGEVLINDETRQPLEAHFTPNGWHLQRDYIEC